MKVRELLADPAKWTKGASAKLADGTTAPFSHEKAVCWCLMGATFRCYDSDHDLDHALMKLRKAITDKTGRVIGIAGFNDDEKTTHEDILAVCRDADV